MGKTLVLNATGKVSAALVEKLLASGHDVLAASRNPTPDLSRSASAAPAGHLTRVRFDYTDPTTFDAALDGVARFFWVAPPMVLDSFSYCRPFFDAAVRRVKKVVLMTAGGVDADDNIPLRQVELYFERSSVAWTHLRPNWFMDNFHTFWLGSIKHQGVIALPAGDARSAFVDSRDIADCAAAALQDERTNGAAYAVSGGEAFSYTEAASILSEAAGRTINYVPIDDESFVAGATQAGIPAEYARLLTALFQVVRTGVTAHVSPTVADLTGHPPRTLAAYAREHRAYFA